MSASREGQRIARLFRQYRALGDSRACDLPSILQEDELEVVESRCANPGYTACLMRAPLGCPGGLIVLGPGQTGGRQRFSIAHELGHYHIPRHKHIAQPPCADVDLLMRDHDSKVIEWEANDFAAELLMPATLFGLDANRRTPCFSSVYELASPQFYDVSVTAAAWRLVQTIDESCALVVTTDGKVEWLARSRSFRFALPKNGQRIRADTAAAAVSRGERPLPDAEAIPPHAWFDYGGDETELLESTHLIPSTGQVLSLLWSLSTADDQE
jgi:hypothetical protein